MFTVESGMQVQLARTLWINTYRGKATNEAGEYLATMRIIPSLPLSREEVPENAPEVKPYLSVLIEDAVITSKELLEFETLLSKILIHKFKEFSPELCQFFYPSLPEMWQESTNPQ